MRPSVTMSEIAGLCWFSKFSRSFSVQQRPFRSKRESESRSFPGAFCTPISPDFHIELAKLDPMGPNEIIPVAAVSASHFSMTKRCHFPSSGLGDTKFGACRGAPWLTQIELKLIQIQTIFHYRKRHQNGAV